LQYQESAVLKLSEVHEDTYSSLTVILLTWSGF